MNSLAPHRAAAAAVAAGFDQAPPGFALEWAPESGHASAAGDLAITTGRYTVKMDAALIDQGRYMTVWRKDAAGGLKVVMDSRQPDPPASPTAPPPAPDPNGRPG